MDRSPKTERDFRHRHLYTAPAGRDHRHPASRGFTLPEAVTAVAIVGVLISLATPTLRSLSLNNRMSAEVNGLMAALHTTRSEAIKRGLAVTVCKSPNGTKCSDDSEWREGWIMFTDPNENHKLDAGEIVIRVQQGWQGELALRYGGPKASYAYLTYYPEGYARPNATFTFCDNRGYAKAKAILINTVGRPRSSTAVLNTSYAIDSENKSLVCSWISP